jgi:hypothetical protein
VRARAIVAVAVDLIDPVIVAALVSGNDTVEVAVVVERWRSCRVMPERGSPLHR